MLVAVLIVVLAVAALFAASRRATTICVLGVTGGVLSVRSGALAERVVADLADVVRRPAVRHATVRISRREGRASVEVVGDVSEPQRQQLRNVIGSLPLAQLTNARSRRR